MTAYITEFNEESVQVTTKMRLESENIGQSLEEWLHLLLWLN